MRHGNSLDSKRSWWWCKNLVNLHSEGLFWSFDRFYSWNYFTADNDTIGIRIPEDKIISTILNNIDFPIIAPSANISGKPSGIQIEDIINDFKDTVDAIIDGGKAKQSLSSTIVKVENGDIKILRQGKITREELLDRINMM